MIPLRRGVYCEDGFLLSCGLLRYWGWICYLGSLHSPYMAEGHEIVLVRRSKEPVRVSYHYLG